MSNEDDLYGDLYGNDDSGDLPGLGAGPQIKKTETKASVPASAPLDSPKSPGASTPSATASSGDRPKDDARAPPTTQPIPTYTEATKPKENGAGSGSATAYASLNGSKYNVVSSSHPPSSSASSDKNSTEQIQTHTHTLGPNNANSARPVHALPANPHGTATSSSTGTPPTSGIETLPTIETVRPSEMKDEGKMFVGGLNWDTTDDGLRNYFSQFGKVDACTIMRDPAGRSRGFAFLTFEDPAAVNAVMVREHYLDGKIIDPKRAIPRAEHQRVVKMFVGGLAPSVTTERLREYFSQYGKVIDATVMVDRDSSRSKGFGFVTFDDQSGAERLFGMPGLEIDGKMIEVKQAQPRVGQGAGERNNYVSNRHAYGNNNFGGGGGGGGGTPFDPAQLATLYQRMYQLTGVNQGQSNWGGMGAAGGAGMSPMMGMGGMGGGMAMMGGGGPGMGMMPGGGGMGMMGGGMGMGGGQGMRNYAAAAAAAGGGGMGGGMMGAQMMGGMGMGGSAEGMMGGGGATGMAGGGMRNGGNIPRGPRANMGNNIPSGPAALGPQRMGQRHQHNYRPY